MATRTKNVNIIDLQTNHMQEDITTQTLSFAMTRQFQEVSNEIDNCLILVNIDDLPETILDELAWELQVTWYDAKAPIDVKKNLIRNCDKIHMYLGTPYAVEQVVKDYFGEAYIKEWFDYGGEPYYFKVVIKGKLSNASDLDTVSKKINIVKNTRSWFEGYEFVDIDNSWDALDTKGLTWDELDVLNQSWDLFETGVFW